MTAAFAERLQLFFQSRSVGHKPGRGRQRGNVDGIDVAFLFQQGVGEMGAVQHADNIFRLVAPKRNSGVSRFRHHLQDFPGRQVGVHADHVGAMKGDVGDLQFAQVENAADHIPVFALHRPFLMVERHRAADFVMGGFGAFFPGLVGTHAEKIKQPPHQPLHSRHDGRQHSHHPANRGGQQQGDAVGAGDRHSLGQHLGENQDHDGHHHRGHGHGAGAKPFRQQRGRQRRTPEC